MRRSSLFPLFTFAFLIGAACRLGSTTVVPMSVEDLTAASPQIVRGHAVGSRSEWNPEHTAIYTYTSFQSDENLKGATGATVVVKQLGGSAGGYTLHVSGVRSWSQGESAVLFLRPSNDQDGTFAVVGLMQGDFRVRRSAAGEMIADNGMHASAGGAASPAGEVNAYSPAAQKISAYQGSQLRLSELESRVRAAVAGSRRLQ